ncbi:MAG: hypothetical protein K9J13_15040 [Saprospiraceae bacterium]|nr:hypothetical protein [Saprospiraceae bacterium]
MIKLIRNIFGFIKDKLVNKNLVKLYLFLAKLEIKLDIKIKRKKYKKLVNIQSLIIRTLHYRIRNILNYKVNGYDRFNDDIVYLLLINIFKLELNVLEKEKYNKFSEEVLNLKKDIIEDDNVKIMLCYYSQLQKIINQMMKYDEDEYDEYLLNDIENYKATTENIKELKKEIKESSKQEAACVYERSSMKLDFTLNNIITIITLITTLIFIGSYIYNSRFYLFFGIEIQKYFLFSDYIDNSISIAEKSLIFTIFGISGILHSEYQMSREPEISNNVNNRNFYLFIIVSFIAISVLGTIISFFINSPNRYLILQIFFLLLSPLISIYISRKYFKNWLKSQIFIFIIFNFLIISYTSAYVEIDMLKWNIKNNNKNEKIIYNKNNSNLKDLFLIGMTSNYVFLTDSLMTKTVIKNRDTIKKIEIIKE